jgi:CRP-like cAMP-binding protein
MMALLRTVEMFAQPDEILMFQAGEVIFCKGAVGQVMYGVLAGDVVLQVDGQTVETIEAGDVFGEGALVRPNHLRGSTAIAQTDCKLIAVSESRFKLLIENTPMFAIEVLRSFSNRLQRFKHPQMA